MTNSTNTYTGRVTKLEQSLQFEADRVSVALEGPGFEKAKGYSWAEAVLPMPLTAGEEYRLGDQVTITVTLNVTHIDADEPLPGEAMA